MSLDSDKAVNRRAVKKKPSKKASVRPQPLIAVRDVRASSRWYQHLLGLTALPEHEHRDTYDRLFSDGRLILQLHAWDEEDHPNLVNRDAAPLGHGVVIWFEADDFDAAVERARSLHAEVIQEPRVKSKRRASPGVAPRPRRLRDCDRESRTMTRHLNSFDHERFDLRQAPLY